MQITKGLIIDEPWISRILKGEKVWEMRSTHTSHRGIFALIRKGSGLVVGVANLQRVSGPYDATGLADTVHNHCVGSDIFSQPDYKWWYAWELSDVQRLQQLVPYVHKSGAVTWVSLDEAAINAIHKGLSRGAASTCLKMASATAPSSGATVEAPDGPAKTVRKTKAAGSADEEPQAGLTELRITLTQGNVNNAHFYIPRQTTLFPESAWGGKNKREVGEGLQFDFQGLDYPVFSDIDSSKRILRNRSAVREFYSLHQVSAEDEIKIEKVAEGTFKVSPCFQ